ncbi:hypothetical protein SCLCIDRAFT_26706 [Scleroderma citrinum Foug A]|uniref:Uncharacterized protein n=1 Tax=Scleroderma citrinum Foug A TaxID=1036808 RepID=A0A0C3A6H0_9AGAM|nr:hypothetical protein SCLCIDRAFT_26706 [Scleroderma citrinum Foug A]
MALKGSGPKSGILSRPHDPAERRTPVEAPPQSSSLFVTPLPRYTLLCSSIAPSVTHDTSENGPSDDLEWDLMLSDVGNNDSVTNQDYESQAPCDDTPLPASPVHDIPEQMYDTPLPTSPVHNIPEQMYDTLLPASPAHDIPEQTYVNFPLSPAHNIPEQTYDNFPPSPVHDIPKQTCDDFPSSPVHSDYETYTHPLIDLDLDELTQLSLNFPKHAQSMADTIDSECITQ